MNCLIYSLEKGGVAFLNKKNLLNVKVNKKIIKQKFE